MLSIAIVTISLPQIKGMSYLLLYSSQPTLHSAEHLAGNSKVMSSISHINQPVDLLVPSVSGEHGVSAETLDDGDAVDVETCLTSQQVSEQLASPYKYF